jgi:hypothetical protein
MVLRAHDSLHAALLKIDSALVVNTTSAPCAIVVVIGAVATAAGIVPCVWWFVLYDWADPAIFKVFTQPPHHFLN